MTVAHRRWHAYLWVGLAIGLVCGLSAATRARVHGEPIASGSPASASSETTP